MKFVALLLGWALLVCAQVLPPCERGNALFQAKSFRDAQDVLWQCVIAGAPDKEPAHQLALTYRELKNYDSGLRQVQPALRRQPRSVDLLYVAGFLQFRLGHHQESIRLLGQAYQLDKADWRVYQAFALNYVVLHIKEGALEEFQNAIALNPRNAELHYQLARFYYSDNRLWESIAESQKALALFPDYVEVYSNLGLCYEALADSRRAAESFERAVSLSCRLGLKDEWPFLNYAAFLIKQGSAERSLPVLRQALAVNPQSAKARYYMGRALRRLERITEAKGFLEESLQLDPKDPAAYFELGMLLMKEGDRTRARALLERFQSLRKQETQSRALNSTAIRDVR